MDDNHSFVRKREKIFLLRSWVAHMGGHLCIIRTNKNNSHEIQSLIKGKSNNSKP